MRRPLRRNPFCQRGRSFKRRAVPALANSFMITHGVMQTTAQAPPPFQPPAKLKPKKTMSAKDAERAIKASGSLCLKARKLKACAEVGDYLTQVGVLSYGRACLAAGTEHARLGLEECERLRTEKSADPDYRLNLLNTKDHLIHKLLEGGEALVKSAAIDTPSGLIQPPQNRSFLPRQAVFPVVTKEMHVYGGGHSPPTDEHK